MYAHGLPTVHNDYYFRVEKAAARPFFITLKVLASNGALQCNENDKTIHDQLDVSFMASYRGK